MGLAKILCFMLILCGVVASSADLATTAKLVPSEVAALKAIAKRIGKKDWDFSKDPCSGEGNWSLPFQRTSIQSQVRCDCTFSNNTVCHVNYTALKSQNLTGNVPPEFAKLPYLKVLDLSRNYFRGNIPLELGKLKLENLSFMGNRLSGPFPTFLTRMTSLLNLSLEGNQFHGSIPPQIGLLFHVENLILSSNFFTGTLPVELTSMTSLADLRLNDNNFTGMVPDFIGRITKLEKLYLQGSGLSGPIPSSFSSLKKLKDLRISDLVGGVSDFPLISNWGEFKHLILRRCSIQGSIPEYIGNLSKLETLDLSFNNLTGVIPDSLPPKKIKNMYLTGNKLTGKIPRRISASDNVIDVSFNNFSLTNSSPEQCQQGNTNMVESHSFALNNSFMNVSNLETCLQQGFPCAKRQRNYTLYINCGGGNLRIGNVEYESDVQEGGASRFYLSPKMNWAFSNTGNFMERDGPDEYIVENNGSTFSNSTSPIPELYQTARGSAISLTYYGLCLGNGSYNVTLHFAEIQFTNDSTFSSLGTRIFDVYLQGNLVLKDFNIAAEAGGTGKPILRTFPVVVSKDTLKIQFYWAGRGTTGIPQRGYYGPLISAIAVVPNFTPPTPPPEELLQSSRRRNEHLGARQLAWIIPVAACLLLVLMAAVLMICYHRNKKISEISVLDLKTGLFTLRQMKAATNNFDASLKVGEGGFGSVYKGLLPDGTIIAVKQLSTKSKQGIREFVNEIGMISALQHPNLVKLYGCCVEGNHLLLVYEYMENNCLARALFGHPTALKEKLDWKTRKKICIGIARGLLYLHEESKLKIVHRDIKASNVLLDNDLEAKISDFGLAKLNEDDKSHITTRVAGTVGYMAPEYAMRGYLTPKADVYSFGIVLLEIVSGKSSTISKPDEDDLYLLDWAYVLQEKGDLLKIVDSGLGCEYSLDEAMLLLNVALLCTNASPSLRPDMAQVVSMLEGRTDIQEILSDPGFSMAYYKARVVTHFWQRPGSTRGTTAEREPDSSALSEAA